MSLFRPGDQICGRFTVEELIGVGGMSEVYRGRDDKLHGRAVAIKALRKQSIDGESRARIQDEVRVLCGLTHPHIAVLYDVCSHERSDVMVMELVKGDTLAGVLRRGRLSEREALQYGIQVADALAFAHRHGIVHRDVKPSNIIVTAQGAKLIDFGLAHLVRPATIAGPAGASSGEAPDPAGTPIYMSPEQGAGADVDHRTDIYSFGLVLCQALTGSTLQGDSGLSTRTFVSGLLGQIASRPIRLVVERCLAVDPDDRWVHASDLHHALVAVSETERSPAPPRAQSSRLSALSRVSIGAIAGAVALLIGWSLTRPDLTPVEYQFAIAPPAGTHFVSLETGGPAAIAPDGRTVAFVVADESGTTRIWTRRLDGLEATPLYGTERASHPFWSPDSQSLAYFTPGRLQRIPAVGGMPRVITDAAQGRGGSWSTSGVIVFAPSFTAPLFRVSADGGDAEPVTALDFSQRETSHRWPVFLPDGQRFLFFVRSDRPEVRGLYSGSLGAPAGTRVGDIASSAVYAPSQGSSDGHLVFAHEGFLTAQRFSPSDGRLIGDPAAVLQLPAPDEDTSAAPLSVSANGILVVGGGSVFRQVLTWVGRDGRESGRVNTTGQHRNLRLSPDGQKLAVERLELRTGLAGVWLFDLDRNVQQRLDEASGAAFSPVWSPDGTSLLYASYRGEEWALVRRALTSPAAQTLLTTTNAHAATDWSRDGHWIIYQERGPGTRDQWDLGVLDVATSKTRTLLQTEYNEYQAQLSPDASWLAYTSNESGVDEVYVQRFPSLASRLRISTAGGSQPKWSSNGHELLYVSQSQDLMSVAVDTSVDPLRLSASRILARLQMIPATGFLSISNYDMDRAAARFLIATPPEPENLNQQLTVLVNWPAQLNRR